MQPQVVSIQVLRGIAALLVVVAHVVEHPFKLLPNSVVITGRFGVEIFFVISGFIIAFVAGRGRFDPGDFAIRRLFRVVPLYWLCTMALVAMTLLAPDLFKRTVYDGAHLLRSLFFIPSPDPINPSDWRPIFKLGWTLNYEMFFYGIMACLFWCRSSLQRASLLTIVMAALMLASFFVEQRSSALAFYANLNLLPFVCGVWLAELEARGRFDGPSASAIAGLAGAAVLATGLLYLQDFDSLRQPVGHAIMTLAALLIVATGLAAESRVRDAGPIWAIRIGDASYSLYLTHMFVVGAAWFVMDRLGIRGLTAVAGGAAAVVLSVGVSLASHRLFEVRPNALGRRLGRAFADRRRPRSVARKPVSLDIPAPAARAS